jgi:NAD(P)-dependent dehydrogenase (short-subunit alcohol dehydrogenase family)
MVGGGQQDGESAMLTGRVAVVAGATRGAGRGVARMLGEAGATVYCTGRSGGGAPARGRHAGRPETVEETAALVAAAGGTGIAVAVDHADDGAVRALFERVEGEHGALDVLVNVLGAPRAEWKAFAELDVPAELRGFEEYVRPHVLTCWHAVMRLRSPGALIVTLQENPTLRFMGGMFYDLGPLLLKRLMYNLAEEQAPRGVTAVALAPGFMRTEEVLATFGATEDDWRDVAQRSPQARSYGLAGSESPCFVGRAVAALAADPQRLRYSGSVLSSWRLADEYGFADVDGERPHWGRYFAENFPELEAAEARTGRWWEVVGN